jgi:hypothetical protein
MDSQRSAFHGRTMKLGCVAALALTLTCIGCGAHDASDPEYGQMFKKTTRDRVQGTEFWGSRSQKDCNVGSAVEVCTPIGASETSDDK